MNFNLIIVFLFQAYASTTPLDFLEITQDKDHAEEEAEYIAVVDGIYAEAISDRTNYGYYSVTAEQLSDDIDALENLYEIMDEDETVEMNGLEYEKEDVNDYIVIDKDLRSYFEDDEVIVIYGGGEGSDIISVDELEQMEEEMLAEEQTSQINF